MRKTKQRSLGDGNDSVLDTMTNVVAVLLIVVAVTQLGVGDAVARGRNASPAPALTQEAVDAAATERALVEDSLRSLQERWGELEANASAHPIELSDLEAAIDELQRELAEPATIAVDPAELERLRDEIARLEREIAAVVAALKSRAEEKLALVASMPQPETLTVPDPDPKRSEGKRQVTFIARRDSVLEYEWDQLKASYVEHFKVFGPVSRDESTWTRTCARIPKYFDEHDVGSRNYRFRARVPDEKISVSTTTGRTLRVSDLLLVIELRDDVRGAGLNELAGDGGAFKASLAALDPKRDWLLFRVWDDSFEEYLAARNLAESLGFDVGWVAYDMGEDIHSESYLSDGGGAGRTITPD